MSRFETNQIAVLAPLDEAEVAILADAGADEGQVEEIVERAEAEFVEEPGGSRTRRLGREWTRRRSRG